MKTKQIVFVLLLILSVLIPGCSGFVAKENTGDSTAIITDRAGREWDVSHARDAYDMNPDYYNYGLGIGVISSVDNPVIIEEGDPGYPKQDSDIQIFGVNHNGEQRAYGVRDLTGHEVFNDVYPGESEQYVAVTF